MNKSYTIAIGGGILFAAIWFAFSGLEEPYQAALSGGAFTLAYLIAEIFFKEEK
ncbi:MAG: hypothetical protein ACQESA_02900 [Patescibacteria group bacterium]